MIMRLLMNSFTLRRKAAKILFLFCGLVSLRETIVLDFFRSFIIRVSECY